MDLQNLKEHHEELLSFMENNGYSSTYIRRFREEINRILAKADSHDWQSYRDVYLDYLKAPHSKDYLRNKRTIIGALEQFDDFDRMPDGRSRHTLFERGAYHLLCSEFRELIDFYRIYEKKRGKKESTMCCIVWKEIRVKSRISRNIYLQHYSMLLQRSVGITGQR